MLSKDTGPDLEVDDLAVSNPRRLMESLSELLREAVLDRTEVDRVFELLEQNLRRCVYDDNCAGPLDEVLQRNPWLTTAVQGLRQERQELQASLGSLRAWAKDVDGAARDQLRRRFDEYAERYLAHEVTAEDILEEAFPGPDWIRSIDAPPMLDEPLSQ